MKKYIGLLKTEEMSMMGCNVRIKSRFSDSIEEIENWVAAINERFVVSQLKQSVSSIILENTSEFEEFFGIFEDYTPLTAAEIESAQNAQRNLQELRKDEFLMKQIEFAGMLIEDAKKEKTPESPEVIEQREKENKEKVIKAANDFKEFTIKSRKLTSRRNSMLQ